MAARPTRYAPNTQNWFYTKYRMTESCPFNKQDKFVTDANIVSRRDLFGQKPGLLTSLVYQEKIKAITRRVSLPTLSRTRKASLVFQKFENQQTNRDKYEKMYSGMSDIQRCQKEVMYEGFGTLRPTMRVADRHSLVNDQYYLAQGTGSCPTKTLGVDTWHTPTGRKTGQWQSLQSNWASKAHNETRGFVSSRPAHLKGYSLHSGK